MIQLSTCFYFITARGWLTKVVQYSLFHPYKNVQANSLLKWNFPARGCVGVQTMHAFVRFFFSGRIYQKNIFLYCYDESNPDFVFNKLALLLSFKIQNFVNVKLKYNANTMLTRNLDYCLSNGK